VALDIPETAAEVDNRAKADVQRELSQSNPFLKNSWLGALVTAYSNRIFDFYIQLKIAIVENFPDTATDQFLVRWAAIWGKSLSPATQSFGNAVALGTATSEIPLGTALTVEGVGEYETTALATISDQIINLVGIVRAGSTASALATSAHGLANGVSVTISGSARPEYNVTALVTVISANEFQYQVSGTPSNDTPTNATASFTTASVPLKSVEFASSFNLDAGSPLSLQSPLAGVDDVLTVDFLGISGGTDLESSDSLRSRMLDRIQNPVAHFNAADIIEKAKEVAGVTRVFVKKITPSVGDVTIYFMRDNDVDPIPSGADITETKDKILEITPANTGDSQVIVLAPTAVAVNFTFTALSPNTTTMQTSISSSLRQFFDERADLEVNVQEDAYRTAIFGTIDITTGDRVASFTLTDPTGDITISAGEIGTLGAIIYP